MCISYHRYIQLQKIYIYVCQLSVRGLFSVACRGASANVYGYQRSLWWIALAGACQKSLTESSVSISILDRPGCDSTRVLIGSAFLSIGLITPKQCSNNLQLMKWSPPIQIPINTHSWLPMSFPL